MAKLQPLMVNGLPQPIPRPDEQPDEQIAPPGVQAEAAPIPSLTTGLRSMAMPSLAHDPRRDELAAERARDEQTLDKVNNHSRLGNVIPITPGEGKGHSFLRGLEHFGRGVLNTAQFAGNAIGDLYAPGLMMSIPGTDLNNAIRRGQATRGLSDIAHEEQATQKNEAQQTYQQQEGDRAEAAAAKDRYEVEHPKETQDKFALQQTDQGLMRVNETTGEATPVQAGGKPLQKPDAPDQFVYQQTDHGLMRINKQTGEAAPVQYNGQALKPFEKPPVVNVNAANSRTDKNYQFESHRIDAFGKPIEDAVARFGRLQDTLDQRTPQADALIAPELLTVMAGGAGSGLRMNEAEISRIVGGRSNMESIKASLNKWQSDPSKALSITDSQRQQIRVLMNAVHGKLIQKQQVLDAAREALVNTEDPHEMKRITTDAHKKLSDIDSGSGGGGNVVYARDPQGNLHQAPAGTPLPAGWTEEKR